MWANVSTRDGDDQTHLPRTGADRAGPNTTHFRVRPTRFSRRVSPGEISVVSLADLLCDAAMCRVTTRDGLPAYWDDNHLSRRGAPRAGPELA